MSRPTKNEPEQYTELEKDLLEAANLMLAHKQGKLTTNKNSLTNFSTSNEVDVKLIRNNLHLTQEQFASIIGKSVHSVRHWENGRRIPDGTTKRFLQVLNHNPKVVLDALDYRPT